MRYAIFILLLLPCIAIGQQKDYNISLRSGQDPDSVRVLLTDSSGVFAGRGHFRSLPYLANLLTDYMGVAGIDTDVIATQYDISKVGFMKSNQTQTGSYTHDGGDFTQTFNNLGAWNLNFDNSSFIATAQGAIPLAFGQIRTTTSDTRLYISNGTDHSRVSLIPSSLSLDNNLGTYKFTTNPTIDNTVEYLLGVKTATGAINRFDASGLAADANVVHKTGTETVAGIKSFADTTKISKLALFNRTTPSEVFRIRYLDAVEYPIWNEGVNIGANAAAGRENLTFQRGFNLSYTNTQIDPRWTAWGESWESFYHPTLGDSIAEWHRIYINQAGAQYRPESMTLPMSNLAGWEKYYTLGRLYIKDPTTGNPYFRITRNSSTSTGIALYGSLSEKGLEITTDASATNVTFGNNYTGTDRHFYADNTYWDYFHQPAFTSYTIGGGYYNRARGHLLGWGDNDTALGVNGFRFSDVEACALKITDPASYATKYFEVTDAGAILMPGLQDFADDAAAAAGGIPVGGLYRTGSIVKIRVS